MKLYGGQNIRLFRFFLLERGNVVPEMAILQTLLPMTAVFATGITSGFLAAVSFLDARTFAELVNKKDAETIKKLFPIWWPYGKAFMVPNLAFNVLAHIGTYAVTGQSMWILSGCIIASIGPYTAFMMKEDIETLRGTKQKTLSDNDVYAFTKSFCRAHHARLVLALFSFGTSIYLTANS